MTGLRIAYLNCHDYGTDPARTPYGLTWIRKDGTRRIPSDRAKSRATRIHGWLHRHGKFSIDR